MCDVRQVLTTWTFDPLVLGALGTSSALYVRGARRLWRTHGVGHGVRPWQVAAFTLGQLTLIAALVSPLDALSDWLFSAHMTQHELLMLVAAPVLVLGRPLVTMSWGLPEWLRVRAVRGVGRSQVRATWRTITDPLFTLVLHGAIVWTWHVPVLFEAALANETIHAVQHLTFFASAALFWWGLVHGRCGRTGYGLAVLFVFATAMHTSVLGALIGLAARVIYPAYVTRSAELSFDALADQQLAGIIMWVPAGVLLTLVAMGLLAAWLGDMARTRERDARRARARDVEAIR